MTKTTNGDLHYDQTTGNIFIYLDNWTPIDFTYDQEININIDIDISESNEISDKDFNPSRRIQ